jgi:hypothetical protein
MKKKRKPPPRGKKKASPIKRSPKHGERGEELPFEGLAELVATCGTLSAIKGANPSNPANLGKMLVACVKYSLIDDLYRALKKYRKKARLTDSEQRVWEAYKRLWPKDRQRDDESFRAPLSDLMNELETTLPPNLVPDVDTVKYIVKKLGLNKYQWHICKSFAGVVSFKVLVKPKDTPKTHPLEGGNYEGGKSPGIAERLF